MSIYTVYEPPIGYEPLIGDAGTFAHAERFVFVRDGFSFAAFLFGPLWMLRHRLWLALLGYIVLIGVAMAAMVLADMPAAARYFVVELVSLLIGLEAASLRRAKFNRQGWHNLGVVAADDVESAERRFFDSWVAGRPAPAPAPMAALAPEFPLPPGSGGFLPEAGARA